MSVKAHKTLADLIRLNNRNVFGRSIVFVTCAAFVTTTAFAQDKSDTSSGTDTFLLKVETPIADQSGLSALGADLDITTESIGSQIFDLDLTKVGCLTGEETCLRSDETLDMGYSKPLTTSIMGKGLDIQLTPRASVRFNDGNSSAAVGALVRIGDDLKDGEEFKSNTWYLFAGADAEALSYSPNDMSRVSLGDFHLQDRVIVGDAQAGVGYRLNKSTDISLGYFRREITSFGNETEMQGTSFSEDAAALSFTWRR